MERINRAEWIHGAGLAPDGAQIFAKRFGCRGGIKRASLEVTALGVYEARLNGSRVGDFILAPGWTSYASRLQVQVYDVTGLLCCGEDNELEITLGQGWRFRSGRNQAHMYLGYRDTALLATLYIEYADGSSLEVPTDSSWSVRESKLRYSDIYNGDIYDAGFSAPPPRPAAQIRLGKEFLIAQEGETVTEHERLPARRVFVTPRGETVVDFGRNITGYVEFEIEGPRGHEAVIHHGETLDNDGCFYNLNYRTAKAQIRFTCDGGRHTYKPALSFFGFRYIKLENWPGQALPEHFTAVVVHSQMRRTGFFECSDNDVNRLFQNIIWSQEGNFLDVPTDCPQRNERLGWTGDAQVFVRTASYNFDVERFFKKWLRDLEADQLENGSVPHVIPDTMDGWNGSTAWGDAAVICPWQIYVTYGDSEVLKDQYSSMKKWVDFSLERSEGGLITGGKHFGDWLGLDAQPGSYKGATDEGLIATAYLVFSARLLARTAGLLGKSEDAEKYEKAARRSAEAFAGEYMSGGRIKTPTQTACVLALHFGLAHDPAQVAQQLNELISRAGHLTTGFLGTPYLLHVLSENGYVKTAYDLLLRREYPSWLYPLSKDATTIWEHWDGIKPDGSMWSADMNSFNHYAYGAVADWLYGVMAGINPCPGSPGFRHIVFRPLTDERIDWVKARIESRCGTVASEWRRKNGLVEYRFTVPQGCTARVELGGEVCEVGAGEHVFCR